MWCYMQVPSRLPYLFMEQYIGTPAAIISNDSPDGNNASNSCSPDSSNAKRKASNDEFQGKHLIILQHGFLGNSFDMRLLYQTLMLLCPKNTMVSVRSSWCLFINCS